jgi:hypothetical protein
MCIKSTVALLKKSVDGEAGNFARVVNSSKERFSNENMEPFSEG